MSAPPHLICHAAILEHAQQLRASSPAGPDVEVPQVEVLRARVQQPHPAAERQPLATGVGDGMAQPRVPQQLGVGELLPAVQHDALRVRLGHPHEGALGHLRWSWARPAPGARSARRPRAPGACVCVCGSARVLSALQHGPRRHLSPSENVMRAPATVQHAGRLVCAKLRHPSLRVPAPPCQQEIAIFEPAWVGIGTWQDSTLPRPRSSSPSNPSPGY